MSEILIATMSNCSNALRYTIQHSKHVAQSFDCDNRSPFERFTPALSTVRARSAQLWRQSNSCQLSTCSKTALVGDRFPHPNPSRPLFCFYFVRLGTSIKRRKWKRIKHCWFITSILLSSQAGLEINWTLRANLPGISLCKEWKMTVFVDIFKNLAWARH